jgi:Uma2 family endonuclease
MPHVKKAELVEGVVYMPSPVHLRAHAQPHGVITTWLGVYCAGTPGVMLADNATIRLDAENEVQPDALLRLEERLGGRSRVSEDDYLEGAPELVVEIVGTSAAYDLHDKLRAYRRNGVQEYLVWQVYDRRVDWFRLQEGEYVPLVPDHEGILQSVIFPGLRLHLGFLLDGNVSRVLDELRNGLAAADHAAFVTRLSTR